MATEKLNYGSGDAISSLPDETLAQILSFLPTKLVASTSVLSKRWRNLFPLMIHLFASQHNLDFDHSRKDETQESFRAFVDKTLSLHRESSSSRDKSKKMKKFSLTCRDERDETFAQTNSWITYALERGVSDLDLRIEIPWVCELPRPLLPSDINSPWVCDPPRPLPSELFTSKTLVRLTLGQEICLGDTCPKVYLPLLKYLSLHTVYLLEDNFQHNMILGSPALEELVVTWVELFKDEPPQDSCTISHKTLKRLTMRTEFGFIQLDTPSLVYLDFSENNPRCILDDSSNLKSLVEVRLNLVKPTIEDRSNLCCLYGAIHWIRNAPTLYFSSSTVEAIYSLICYYNFDFPEFRHLVKLCFESDTKQGWKVLTSMLKNSPKLETLLLKGLHFINSPRGVCVKENTVKVLEVYGYRGRRKELKQLERFLCQREFLRVMKVQLDARIEGNGKKLQIAKDDLLALLPKHRSSCQIQFV